MCVCVFAYLQRVFLLVAFLADRSIYFLPSMQFQLLSLLLHRTLITTDLALLKGDDAAAQELVNSLQLLELLAPSMDLTLQEKVT